MARRSAFCTTGFVGVIAAAVSCVHHTAAREPTLQPGRLASTWYAGGTSCSGQPQFFVHSYNEDLFILRQAACTNYEKPFLYLIFGSQRALLLDTGAGHVDVAAQIDTLVSRQVARAGGADIPLIVAHSHAHGDHIAGDSQLVRRPNTTVVGRDPSAVAAFFGITHWPTDTGTIDLGDRVLDILPIPGLSPQASPCTTGARAFCSRATRSIPAGCTSGTPRPSRRASIGSPSSRNATA